MAVINMFYLVQIFIIWDLKLKNLSRRPQRCNVTWSWRHVNGYKYAALCIPVPHTTMHWDLKLKNFSSRVVTSRDHDVTSSSWLRIRSIVLLCVPLPCIQITRAVMRYWLFTFFVAFFISLIFSCVVYLEVDAIDTASMTLIFKLNLRVCMSSIDRGYVCVLLHVCL